MRIRNGKTNVSSEEKCLQRRLETVQGRRVVNGARQPVPCRRICDDECTSAELCPRPLKYNKSPLRARCSPAPAHTRLTTAAPSVPCAMNIHGRQALTLSGGVEYGVVHINYVVNSTANQSGLVTLTFDLLTLKVVSESHVTWSTSVPILVFLGLSVLDLGPMYVTDRQTSDRIIA